MTGNLGSPTYASGFSGSGWRTDVDGNMTVDSLTVRKSMNVYELNINKIRSGNGSYWFSDGAKIKNVDSTDPSYIVFHFDSETGNPFRPSDIIRCQVWTGIGIKYYTYKGSAAESNTLILILSLSVNKDRIRNTRNRR